MRKLKKLVVFISAIVLSVVLVSCTPKKMTEAYDKMENCGYEVEKLTAYGVSQMFYGLDIGAETAIICEKEEEEALWAFWFEETEQAKDFTVLLKMTLSVRWEEAEEKYMQYERDGKVVYFGTEKACEDFVG